MNRGQKIIAIASGYLNKLEKPGNKGFYDPEFERKLKSVGWYVSAPWCAFLAKLVYKEAYADSPALLSAVIKLCTGGCLVTFNNFKGSRLFRVSQDPVPGSIAIWKHGNGPQGHAGLVVRLVDANTFETIEGNTNATGSREGDRVAKKLRTLKRDFKAGGLNLVGFINPTE